MADARGQKTGGRKAGTPNKATKLTKEFLQRVFSRAFTETRPFGPTLEQRSLEDRLVDEIVTGAIDPKLLQFLLTMYAGRPSQAVDVTHGVTATLEQLITKTIPVPEADDEGLA